MAIDFCPSMTYNVRMVFIETPVFTRRIQVAMSDDEYAALQQHLVAHPDAGDLVPGAGGIRKIRWSGSGRGKRGGSRSLYFWDCGDCIYMLFVYLKNERADISPAEAKTLGRLVKEEGLK